MKFIRILLWISLTSTVVIYCFPRSWELNLIAQLQSGRSDRTVYFFQFISDSISFISIGIPVVLLVVGLLRRSRAQCEKALVILLAIGLAGLFSITLKKTVREPRPYEVDTRITQLSGGGGYGFPSGHTVEAVAAAASISLLWPELYIILVSFSWALVIMFSRIYLGVHDPGDVMAGMFLGCLSAIILIKITDSLRRERSKPPAT